MERIKVTNDYLQIAQTKVQYSVRKVTEKMDFFITMDYVAYKHIAYEIK